MISTSRAVTLLFFFNTKFLRATSSSIGISTDPNMHDRKPAQVLYLEAFRRRRKLCILRNSESLYIECRLLNAFRYIQGLCRSPNTSRLPASEWLQVQGLRRAEVRGDLLEGRNYCKSGSTVQGVELR